MAVESSIILFVNIIGWLDLDLFRALNSQLFVAAVSTAKAWGHSTLCNPWYVQLLESQPCCMSTYVCYH